MWHEFLYVYLKLSHYWIYCLEWKHCLLSFSFFSIRKAGDQNVTYQRKYSYNYC